MAMTANLQIPAIGFSKWPDVGNIYGIICSALSPLFQLSPRLATLGAMI